MHSLTTPRTRRMAVWSGVLTVGAMLAGGTAFAVPTAGTPTIEAPSDVDAGDTVTVSIALPTTEDVFAYELEIDYDADLVSYVEDSATGPAGGFGSISTGTDSLTYTYTRLGTSPALDGDVDLLTLEFLALEGGDAAFTVDSLVLVGFEQETLSLSPGITVTTSITAVEDDDSDDDTGGTPGAGDGSGDTPGTGDDTPGTDDDPAETGSDAGDVVGGGPTTGSLSDTGVAPFGMIALAAALLLAGIALVAYRKVSTR